MQLSIFMLIMGLTTFFHDVQSAYADGYETDKRQKVQDRSLVQNFEDAVRNIYKSTCNETWPNSEPGAVGGCYVNCKQKNENTETVTIHTLTRSDGSPCLLAGGTCQNGVCAP
ncbi:secreted salivary gland peptide, putative [Ixodes scapularis]|uniref:Secreted salivary gland peptide, putative n=1 Tax=Ixodes scapularis TaxID=6945 RepID=B7PFD8_IXOSC|nr:secreted salivary gland peptide, putative [Ixodes scapularis]|eukprot:XP_002433910.1 secreted salivary gland peptide, putative [Ixodes scapularis]